MPLTVKPALEKLPLATRKDIRDNWEAKKADFEKEISDILGSPYTIEFNQNECLAYSETTSNGAAFTGYITSFVEKLKTYIKSHGDEGKRYFNEAVTSHKISIAVEPTGDLSNTTGKVVDGVYVIHFPHNYFGSWQSINDDHFLAAIDEVERADKDLPLIVKKGIKDSYDLEADKIKSGIAAAFAIPDLIIDPNFAGNYAFLKTQGNKISGDWQARLGQATLDYLKGLLAHVEKDFKGDEMSTEAIQEVLTTKTVQVRAVEKLSLKSYNEAYLKDGMLYLQSPPDQWGSWTSEMGTGIVDQL